MQDKERSFNVAKCIYVLQQTANERTVLSFANETIGKWTDCIVVRDALTVFRYAILYGGESPVTLISTGVSRGNVPSFLEGYRSSVQSRTAGGFNTSTAIYALTLLGTYWRTFAAGRTPTQMYGHSSGGALVECLNALAVSNGIGQCRERITFGAPKACFLNSIPDATEEIQLRWVNEDDPVPCLPFWGIGGGSPGLLVLLSDDYEPDLYRHPSNGRFLTQHGRVTDIGDGTGTNIPSGNAVIGWMTGYGDVQSIAHRITTYRDYLKEAIDREAKEEPPPVLPFSRTVPVPLRNNPVVVPPNQNLVREFDLGYIKADRLHSADGAVSVRVAPSEGRRMQGKIDKRLKATATVGNGVYYVFWMESQIATAPTLGKARSVAAGINTMLRRLGKTASVQNAGWEQSIAAFLSAATTAGNGYEPPLVAG